MKIAELKTQFNEILSKSLIEKINHEELAKSHPDYPIISNISPTGSDIKLTDEQIDKLNDGGNITIKFDINGKYDRSTVDGFTHTNNSFKLSVTSIELRLENEQLVIKHCKCFTQRENWL